MSKYSEFNFESLSNPDNQLILQNDKKLIGIVGLKNSGKDTMGEYLTKHHGFTQYAFANPVKEICKSLFSLSDEQLEDRHLKEKMDTRWGISPREMFQGIGTDFGQFTLFKLFPELKEKIKYREIWVKLFEQWFLKNKDKDIVITDVRFMHEINKIKSMGGQIVRIKRNCESFDNHISEKELNQINLDLIDWEIDNNYELVDLYSQIDKIIYMSFLKKA